jgi:VanZ family protein
MSLDQRNYGVITILYTLFIYITLPITPRIWQYLESHWGQIPLYAIYLLSLLGGLSIIGYLFFISQERNAIVYLKLATIGIIFGYYLKTIPLPAEKLHLLEYGVLSYFMGKLFHLNTTTQRDIRYLQALCVISLIGALDEGIQYYLPNRVFDLKDIFLNSLAGFLGLTCLRLVIYPSAE